MSFQTNVKDPHVGLDASQLIEKVKEVGSVVSEREETSAGLGSVQRTC